MDDEKRTRAKLGQPVPWTQILAILTASSIPIALNRWNLQGFQAAASFLGLMAVTGIVAVFFGRRSRAALIGYFLTVAVVSISILVVIAT